MAEAQDLRVVDMLEELEEILEEDPKDSGFSKKDIEFILDTLKFVEGGEEMTPDQKRKVEDLWRSRHMAEDRYTDEDCWREINKDYPDEPTYQGASGTVEERYRQKMRLRGR